jgi:hypothetical protein
MATPNNQVSRDAALALTEFSDEFKDALALSTYEPWAADLGLMRTTNALRTTFPIPLDAVGYKELKGDIKFRSLYKRSLTMTGKEWFDGVEAKAVEVEAPEFVDWAGQPAKMADEWQRQPNVIVASLLALSSYNGPLLGLYADTDTGEVSTRRLFAADHPYNVLKPSLGTFDNRLTCTLSQIASGEIFDRLELHFSGILNPSGTQSLGLSLDGGKLLIPNVRRQVFKRALTDDTLVRAVSNAGAVDATSGVVAAVTQGNMYKGLAYTPAIELASADYFYAIAAARPGLVPWVVQTKGQPEEILHDKSSELYKRQRKIGVAYVGNMNAACALPHPIVRVQITGP